MGVRFNPGFNQATASYRRAEQRLLLVGGGTIVLALIILSLLLLLNKPSADAQKDMVVEPTSSEEMLSQVKLIAPSVQIPRGSRITSAYVKEITWPRDQVPENAIRSIADIENMYASATLAPNQPILRTALSPEQVRYGIDEMLPPGHRAITIPVDEEKAVEGWAQAGSHVDVLLTYLDSKTGSQKTRCIVENAIVLSFGGSLKRTDLTQGEEKPLEAKTATLAVAQIDALKIQTGRAMGRISLVLRSATDTNIGNHNVFDPMKDWEGRQPEKPTAPRNPKVCGFTKFTNPDGSENAYVLDCEGNWFRDEEDAL